jgi:hypothetical protein
MNPDPAPETFRIEEIKERLLAFLICLFSVTQDDGALTRPGECC